MSDTPTSPVNTGVNHKEIDAVFGDGPSLAQLAAPAPTMTAEWRRFREFLRMPSLDVSQQNAKPVLVVARLFALDMLIMFALISIAIGFEVAGVELPDNVFDDVAWTPTLVLLIIVGAPVLEELLFRGWLSGRPAPIMALLSLGAGVAIFGSIGANNALAGLPFLLIGIAGAVIALFALRQRPPMAWFARLFPAFFWLSSIAFALVHLSNYDEGAATIALPLVLPQFVLGLMLGYVRVRFSLWAAMGLHAVHNATLLALAGLMMGLAG